MKKYFPVLARFLFVCCAHTGQLYAQVNSEYTFRQQNVADNAVRYNTEDDAPLLNIDCISANGYGQFVLSSGTGPLSGTEYVQGWYLLANGRYEASTRYTGQPTHPDCIPPGVVNHGTLTAGYSSASKAASNLVGSTTFGWVLPTNRQTFYFTGFNDDQFDISLTGIPNAPGSREIVKSPILSFAPVTTWSQNSNNTHDVVVEADYRDEFDFTCDASFLYLAWCSNTNSTIPSTKEIWFSVIDIQTRAPLPGYPISLGGGLYPTVSCDVRNNRIANPTPSCEVAYITQPLQGDIVWKHISGMPAVVTAHVVTKQYLSPNNGVPLNYQFPYHVRTVTSSAPSGVYHGLYAIVDDWGKNLILYNESNPNIPTGIAAYVDGPQLTPVVPIPPSNGFPGWEIKDAPIEARANPYDNGSNPVETPSIWRGYDQFHCLYQVNVLTPTPREPLLIARASDNGSAHPVSADPNAPSFPASTDTRLVINQIDNSLGGPAALLPYDPSKYRMAINQMGIYVRWRAPEGIEFYSRDLNRKFDEEIEENTLITDHCYVSDGTAHGGSNGAAIIKDTKVTLWSDMKYGAGTTDGFSGIYQRREIGSQPLYAHYGTLRFTSPGAILSVGKGRVLNPATGTYYQAKFHNVPNCAFVFDENNQGITVTSMSSWEYYGLANVRNQDQTVAAEESNFVNNGEIKLIGDIFLNDAGPSTMYPAYLHVHGGADFRVPARIKLTSLYGEFEGLLEPALFPIALSPNSPEQGMATIIGNTIFDRSNVFGNSESGTKRLLWAAQPGFVPDAPPQPDVFLKILSCAVKNKNVDGSSEIKVGVTGAYKSFYPVVYDKNAFTAIRLNFVDPRDKGSITITDNIFDEIHGRQIYIWNSDYDFSVVNNYADIMISGNDFNRINRILDEDGPEVATNGTYGIVVRDFNSQFASSSHVVVEGNTFQNLVNWNNLFGNVHNHRYSAAICFLNTTGNILGNIIKDKAFRAGIWLRRSIDLAIVRSLLCGNILTELHVPYVPGQWTLYGMQTENYKGIVQNNTIVNSTIPFASEGNSYCTLLDNRFSSIFTLGVDDPLEASIHQNLGAIIDLSGQHGPMIGGVDRAGHNNIISSNGAGIFRLVNDGYLELADFLATYPWTNFGENNFFLDPSPTTSYAYYIRGFDVNLPGPRVIHKMDNNFWGQSIDPANGTGSDPHYWNATYPAQENAYNISYSPNIVSRTSEILQPSPDCNLPLAQVAKIEQKGDSMLKITDSSCHFLANLAQSAELNSYWAMAADTGKYMIEHCPFHEQAPQTFSVISSGVRFYPGGSVTRFKEYKAWLLSALPLNPSSMEYFCADVEQLFSTLNQVSDTTYLMRLEGANRQLSLMKWLIDNDLCYRPQWEQLYYESRANQLADWRQGDTTVKIDTTLPSMHELGLDSVVLWLSRLGVSDRVLPDHHLAARLSQNPARSESALSVTLDHEAYVQVEVFDLLGGKADGAGVSRVLQVGTTELPLNLRQLSAGSYYLRVSASGFAPVTVKLVRE